MQILDEFDRQIIGLLQTNGRLSNVEVARSLGLSEGTVRKRLERLLSTGTIRIKAIMEPEAFGLAASVFIGIQAELGQLTQIAQQLAALPQVRSVNVTTGTYDVLIEVALPSSGDLLSFLIDKVSTIPGVVRTVTSHVVQTVKRPCDWSVTELVDNVYVQSSHAVNPAGEIVPGAIVVPR